MFVSFTCTDAAKPTLMMLPLCIYIDNFFSFVRRHVFSKRDQMLIDDRHCFMIRSVRGVRTFGNHCATLYLSGSETDET